MTKVFRIKKRKDFLRVANEGVKAVMPTVILQAAQNLCAEEKKFFLGFTATKKLGSATIRNKAKRRLRAATQELVDRFLPSTNYVLIGRYNTSSCDFQALKQDLLLGLKKVNKQLED